MDFKYTDYENLLVKLCEDYYLQNINISELSNKYNISRYKVLKYINEAKEKQIVTIAINSPYARNYELENILTKQFPDTNIYILKNMEDASNQDLFFSKFVADYVQLFIKHAKIISLSWGDTVFKVIDQFKLSIRDDLIFTQFIGEIGKYNSLAGSTRLVQKAAECYESSYLTLSIPLYILNDNARSLMTLEPPMSKTLSTASQSDLLLSGIGTPSSLESVDIWNKHKNLLFPDMSEDIGFLYGRPFNRNGEFINQNDDKTFGLTLTEIFAIKQRVGVCKSKFKAAPCLAALKGNFFTDLFLDENTAWKILGLLKK